ARRGYRRGVARPVRSGRPGARNPARGVDRASAPRFRGGHRRTRRGGVSLRCRRVAYGVDNGARRRRAVRPRRRRAPADAARSRWAGAGRSALMKVAIAGAGAVGRSIARELVDNGHEVLLIDKDPHKVDPRRVEGADWLLGDACELENLQNAKLEEYEVV